jgi:hypothetical protein
MQSLGIDTTTVILPQGRPLVVSAEDRKAAANVRKDIQSGKHVDVSKLSPGVHKALLELGNAEGYGRPGGGSY